VACVRGVGVAGGTLGAGVSHSPQHATLITVPLPPNRLLHATVSLSPGQ
jgi:hypothetical protein